MPNDDNYCTNDKCRNNTGRWGRTALHPLTEVCRSCGSLTYTGQDKQWDRERDRKARLRSEKAAETRRKKQQDMQDELKRLREENASLSIRLAELEKEKKDE